MHECEGSLCCIRLQHTHADSALASSWAHPSACKGSTPFLPWHTHQACALDHRTLNVFLLCPILQAYLKHCLRYILDNCSEDLEFFAHQNDKALVQRLQVCIHIPCQASQIGKLGPALPCPSPPLPCPALPCPALPCLALTCPTLPSALPYFDYSAIQMPWSFPFENQGQVCTCRPCNLHVTVCSCRTKPFAQSMLLIFPAEIQCFHL